MWWGLCLGVWLVSLSAVPLQELLLATAVSLPCGVIAVVARRLGGNAWSIRPRWFRAMALFPAAVVSDTAQVLMAAMPGGRRKGDLEEVPLSEGRGKTARAGGRRAVATFLVSVTPGTFVVDSDPDRGELTVHRLAWTGIRQDQAAVR